MDYLNVIIVNNLAHDTDRECLFPDNENVVLIKTDNPVIRDMLDLLVLLEAFPSRGQARKNWKGPVAFPSGWNEYIVGKKKRQLCIWNPTEWRC